LTHSHKRRSLPGNFEAAIESLSHEGRGIAHINGKTTFIDGGLPGERVLFQYTRTRTRMDEGKTVEILEPSASRVIPRCAHFGVCGGCSLQHLDPAAQLEHKQAVLLEQLRHVGKVEPKEILLPLTGPVWAYRHRARLGVKHVPKKGGVLVGFREKASPFIADITQCEVLHPAVGLRLKELRTLIETLSIREQVPQIEVAIGDAQVALVLRHLAPFSAEDLTQIKRFAETHTIQFYSQSGGLDTITPIWLDPAPPLYYDLPANQIRIEFGPSDFTQVNQTINREMVPRVIDLLRLEKHERVLDLFCGLGNFSLPLARRAAFVTGVEGDTDLVKRAQINAEKNGITNVTFIAADLLDQEHHPEFLQQSFDKVLLDPPRTGAIEIIRRLDLLRTKRVVYVSCNPATLARDASALVHEHGFRLLQTGVMDMFPHTTHVEALAIFERR
jgi:23S rRNA (uracil1939-C5)-methyltransferase